MSVVFNVNKAKGCCQLMNSAAIILSVYKLSDSGKMALFVKKHRAKIRLIYYILMPMSLDFSVMAVPNMLHVITSLEK